MTARFAYDSALCARFPALRMRKLVACGLITLSLRP